MTEYRAIPPENVRVADPKKHQVETDACVYNVLDDYRTIWNPGVFAESLETRKPPMCWAHKWEEPIGRLIDVDDTRERLRTLHQLDDFDAVPRARQAWAQFESGTLTDASFGFSRSKDEPEKGQEGAYRIMKAALDEISPVLRGAVPGAGNFSTRGVPVDAVLQMARSLEAGDMTLEGALAMVRSLSGSSEVRAMHSHAKQDGSGTMNHSHAADSGVGHAHAATSSMPALMPATRAATGGMAAQPNPNNPAGQAGEDNCPSCGATNDGGAAYCNQCGTQLTPPASGRDAMLVTEARSLLADVRVRRH